MGRVFSQGDLEQHRIPNLQAFEDVVWRLKGDLERHTGECRGLICGSTLFKNHNIRSDIDCIVVYDSDAVMATLQGLAEFAARRHVPLNIMPVSRHMAEKGHHSIGANFYTHLELAVGAGGVVCANPLEQLNMTGRSKQDDAVSYLVHKYKRMSQGVARLHAMQTQEEATFLQKVLELSAHVARKSLALEDIYSKDDGAQDVERLYLAGSRTQEERELFLRLREADKAYTKDLMRALRDVGSYRYQDTLDRLRKLPPVALRLVELTIERLAE